ncbi:MAG: helix-hairpin-helix domain-containing protein [Saprospiraceae bacterium]|nr:helix-hairpin-helix domain-containing protein [Saprospiraceae bacterium]MBK7738322.1 helix-hairpin-helix domain-containing protein [Saprospiraceae bacterium]MBK7913105.1 helix-hairpin-helix domain-containing protein [Saprospiraceae bacterium]
METDLKNITLKELQKIPSIGKACALDLWNIGIRNLSDLKDKNPFELYLQLNAITGQTHDICMLYTFRCAVYFASEKTHETQKLNWWYWKDKNYNE